MDSRYITIDGQKVLMNEEQLKVWNKYINDARNAARKTRQCAQRDWRQCSGDCQRCPWFCTGNLIYTFNPLKEFGERESRLVEGTWQASSPETEAILKETERMLYSYADKAFGKEKQGKQILFLHLEYSMSTYEIAEELAIPQRTVAYRLHKMLEYIRAHKDDFFSE